MGGWSLVIKGMMIEPKGFCNLCRRNVVPQNGGGMMPALLLQSCVSPAVAEAEEMQDGPDQTLISRASLSESARTASTWPSVACPYCQPALQECCHQS